MERYFVVVFARNADALRGLQRFELDVFAQTAKRSGRDEEFPFSIDGLLSRDEIDEVVKAGYRVEIQESADKRARVEEPPTEFSQWLRAMEPALTQERAAAPKKTGRTSKRK